MLGISKRTLATVSQNYTDFKWLLPFAVSILVFVQFAREHTENSVLACVIKAAPIVSLAVFTWVRGVRLPQRRQTALFIFLALCLSALGDVFIQLKAAGYFLHGMAAFAASQFLFTVAFGFRPLNIFILLPLLGVGASYYYLLYPALKAHKEPVFVSAVLGYLLLITGMIWRAFAKYHAARKAGRGRNADAVWLLVGSVGALSFVVSDCTLAWWTFVRDFPHADAIVMGTYYLAQLCITLSVLHEGAVGPAKVPNKGKYEEAKKKASPPPPKKVASPPPAPKKVDEATNTKSTGSPAAPRSPNGGKKKHY
ncbi:lysoplasmalogenase-like [Paramacrobiotus metropolitanus]|uniref:lysoplasmalogenase-like n=1 Tax=Paramacrobiotus metropolitanus TaxID=2943436 RepID=UPI00244614DC|nr:lysoplasmalogenase-like [Paramacrobiotus metropolitanus]